MKQCPACNRTYTDDELLFCLEDGTQLQSVGFGTSGGGAAPTTLDANIDANYDPNKTLAFSPARDTSPPPTNVYTPPPQPPPVSQPPAQAQWSPPPTPSYSPMPSAAQAARKGGKGWIIAVIVGVVVVGLVIVVLLMVIGKDNSNSNNSNANQTIANKNANSSNGNASNANRNTSTGTSNSLKDDFSTQNWPTGEAAYGSFYEDGEYHMKGKPNLYVYMFPYNSANYLSKDADVKVTARSVDGTSPNYGYGLIIHGKNNLNKKLDGYGFLIYTGSSPKYEIVRFNDGTPTEIVKWDNANMLRTGTTPNQIEVRAKDTQLSFYINGQFVKSITDTSNITDGYVGLYTSETNEVAFDDMEINR